MAWSPIWAARATLAALVRWDAGRAARAAALASIFLFLYAPAVPSLRRTWANEYPQVNRERSSTCVFGVAEIERNRLVIVA